MSSKVRLQLEEKVQKALFQYAFFRPESALMIAGTLLLTAGKFIFDPSWLPLHPAFILGIGSLLEAALVYISIRDPETGRKVVENMLHDEFQPEKLDSKGLQQQVNRALEYRSRIETAIRAQSDGMLKNNLTETASEIDDWLENIYSLAKRLDRHYKEQPILSEDLQRASKRIKQLQNKSAVEDDPAVRNQIETTLSSLTKQVDTIESLGNTMKRAQLQLENTLSALGTIYSQAMLVDAKDIDRGRAKRLQHEIHQEVTDLSDMLASMDEVYAGNNNEQLAY